jgi:GNAT superfamily N-acetyltransferase
MPTSTRPPALRRATSADDAVMAAVLSRSFFDDPVMTWLVPDEATRDRRQQTFYRAELGHAHANGVVLTTDDRSGAALWLAPKRWKIDTWTMLRQTPAIVRTFGRRIPAALDLQKAMDAAHPREEHWYLSILGTDPDRQGLGVGRTLITGVTDRCDATGVGAYLESSKAANVPYYERFGFVVTGEIQAGDSPVLHSMWRDPA